MGVQQSTFIAGLGVGVGPVPNIPAWSISSEGFAFAEVSITFTKDGGITTTYSGIPNAIGGSLWNNPITVDVGASYWVRLTEYSSFYGGVNGGDTVGTWLSLATTRTWSINNVGANGNPRYSNFKIEVSSDVSGSPVVATLDNSWMIAALLEYTGGA